MLRLLLDENMRADSLWKAVQATMKAVPFDIVRVGDDGPPLGIADVELVQWAAAEQRILISFDKRTLPKLLLDLVTSGHHTPGIVFMSRNLALSEMAEYLQLIAVSSSADEWADTCRFIP